MDNQRYSIYAMLLHWGLAFALAFQIGLGWRMEELDIGQGLFNITQLHKSIGITILILSIARLVLRFLKPPPLSNIDDIWALRLAKMTHIALYAFMIGAPVSGWLMVSTSSLNIDTYLFDILYWPHIPGLEYISGDIRSNINDASMAAHEMIAWVGIALFALHIAGALRHQYYKGEPILLRMLPIAKLQDKNVGSAAIIGLVVLILILFAAAQTWGEGHMKKPNQPAALSSESVVDSVINDQLLNGNIDTDKDGKVETEESVEEENDGPDAGDQTSSEAQAPLLIKNSKPVPWKIVGEKKLSFTVKWNDNDVMGSFSRWDANIYFASGALEQSKITVDIDISSATTSDASANGAIMGMDFFDINNFPKASFTSNSIKALGANRYEMQGELRLKNIVRPITVIFTLDEKETTAHAKGDVTINRLHYKIGETGYDEIANAVLISFDFMAIK